MILPTLKQLQYLAALHEHGHFGRAADAVYVTQSTLSAGLRELEGLLGVTLVERNKRVVRFTPLGERIASKAYAVLREASELTALAKAADKPLTGEVRLGVIPTIAPFFLPRVLPGLRKTYPSLKLYLREDMSHMACEALAKGQIDCVLLALPYGCGDVTAEPLFEDALLAAYHPDDMPNAPLPFPAELIQNEHLLLLEDGHCLKDHALAACDRPELRTERAVLGTSLHTLVQMVDNRLGLTLLPQLAVDAGILEGTHVAVSPFAGDQAKRTIALVWRRNSPREAEFRLLADHFKTQRPDKE
jgi:LysR family transcriptional regulator, hydrogen peroxide-inducible genes activator